MSGTTLLGSWQLWLLIVCMGLVTIANRAGLMLLSNRFSMPETVQRALRFAPAAALAAIALPDLLVNQGAVDVSFSNVRLLAGVVALIAALATRSTIACLLAGMLALHGLKAFGF
jgi:branched-subunit amino acid transport protein